MKISYISHSGFLVETDSAALLFDWYKGALPKALDKPLYIFASHRHGDHYSKDIFPYGEGFSGTRYILSADIKLTAADAQAMGLDPALTERVSFVKPDESITVGDLEISTLGSTDAGVAFIVKVDGKKLFHAGDLNWWLWGDEDTPEEAREMSEAFLKECEKLRGVAIDAAFLPLDPRQPEDQYWLGLDRYARTADIKHIFPMHMWGQYDVIGRFKALDCTAPYRDKIIEITSEDENYEI